MTRIVIVDTGPLVALVDRRDQFHAWATEQFAALTPPLLTCEPVLTEACYLVRGLPNGIPTVLETLSRGLLTVSFDLEAESRSIMELTARYASVPMSLADACLVRMTEQHGESCVLTLDADFAIYRRHGRKMIPLISRTLA